MMCESRTEWGQRHGKDVHEVDRGVDVARKKVRALFVAVLGRAKLSPSTLIFARGEIVAGNIFPF